ncbi:GNAT family N-acetyltransferase [Spiroplasma endosymbiont of Diplazon laetatorius]|uniref:GNAT family N-acetyltransferase n=1 Tax=Spiroplasma endosymbiont of Diplazon laetatorius TaxID=3066322 RepID=UPI0030D393FA
MTLKYDSKISENEKYDLIAKAYLSYFADPVYDEVKQIKFENYEVLECKNHSNAIVTSNWNYEIKNFEDVKKYNAKFLVNFTERKYNNQKLDNFRFKGSYKFMSLNLEGYEKLDIQEIENAQFEKLTDRKDLDDFVKIVGDVFSEEGSDNKKFYGIFDEYNELSELFIIKYNQKIVGTGHLINFENKLTIVDDITMSEEVRGKGLATFLMKSLINRCIEMGQKEICLIASEDAFNIYKKLGFEEEGFWLEQFKLNS